MPHHSKSIVIENGFVSIRVKEGYDYDIDLSSIKNYADLLRRKDHLSEKRWMNRQLLE
jgi:hypothetical protein